MSRLKSLGLAVVLLFLTNSLTTAAVDLNYFRANSWTAAGVELDFETGSEVDHIAFNIYRSTTNKPISPTGQADLTQMTKLNDIPIRNPESACGMSGHRYIFLDEEIPATPNTFYYYLESLPCTSPSPHVYGDGSNGLAVTRPGTTPPPTSVPATSTLPPAPQPTSTSQPTATTQPTQPPASTGTPQPTASLPLPVTVTPQPGQPTATTAPGQPTATTAPGQPTATTAPGQPTPRPGQPTATTAPGQPTPRPGQPTTAPAPGQPTARPGQPTTAPAPGQPPVVPGQPTGVAGVPPVVPGQPQPTFALPPAPVSGSDPFVTLPADGSVPGAESPVVAVDPATGEIALAPQGDTGLQPGTTTLNGSVTLVTPSPVAISPALGEPPVTTSLVAGQQQSDPLDWLIQGIIGLIIIAIIGIGGLLALTYARNR